MDDQIKKLSEQSITSLNDHKLTTNVHYMPDLALMKGLFTKYESFYKAYQGQYVECMFIENNYLKGIIR